MVRPNFNLNVKLTIAKLSLGIPKGEVFVLFSNFKLKQSSEICSNHCGKVSYPPLNHFYYFPDLNMYLVCDKDIGILWRPKVNISILFIDT